MTKTKVTSRHNEMASAVTENAGSHAGDGHINSNSNSNSNSSNISNNNNDNVLQEEVEEMESSASPSSPGSSSTQSNNNRTPLPSEVHVTVTPGKSIGLELSNTNTGLQIINVDQACDFHKDVEVGDFVVAINDKKVNNQDDLIDYPIQRERRIIIRMFLGQTTKSMVYNRNVIH